MNKIAIITGATAGIGIETARVFSQHNFDLILTGRRKERLNEIKQEIESANCSVLTLNFDIQSKKQTDKALESLPEKWKAIDVLVNNAGLAAGFATINNADVNDWEAMIDTNIKGLLYISRTISNWMINRKQGHIINISSISGKEVYPNGSVYCGTKHAVEAISKAMRIELAPHYIKVSTVSPGAVDTEFSLVRFKGDQQKASHVYNGFTPLNAGDVAESIYFVVSRPAHVNINDILIMPLAQSSGRDIHREE